MTHGRRVSYVGLVICRQRPGTARGVVFLTLEDETGFVNVVVWPHLYARHLALVKTAQDFGSPLRIIETVVDINDKRKRAMAERVVAMCGGTVTGKTVGVLGVTFKENVPDIRNTRVVDIARELADFGIAVQLADPMADGDLLREEYGLGLTAPEKLEPADAVVLAVAHKPYRDGGWRLVRPLLKPAGGFVADVPGLLDRGAIPQGVTLWRL